MSENTEIRLPLHVRSTHVLQVIGKVVGEPWAITLDARSAIGSDGEIAKQTPVDVDGPAGKENGWKIQFDNFLKSMAVKASDHSADFGVMAFTDASGQSHQWYWHTEDEDEECKNLRPGSHALAVAVGRRLVEFFGGQVCYSTATDTVDYEVGNAQARFPKRAPDQGLDDRWYQFQNALRGEPLLTRQELRDAMGHVGTDGRYDALEEVLEIQGVAAQMERDLPAAPVAVKRKPGSRL